MSIPFRFSQENTIVALTVFLAVALQIQVTLFKSAEYIGLRLNLADLFLPLIGFYILGSLLFAKSRWPGWQKPAGYWIPALLSLIILFGLLHFYALHGEVSRWGLVNKFTGWFALMAYFGAGAWIAANLPGKSLPLFTKTFVLFFTLLLFAQIALLALQFGRTGIPGLPTLRYQIEGLMGNKNAYAFLFITVIFFATLFSFKKPDFFLHPAFLPLFWALSVFGIWLNGSRIFWIALALALPFFFIAHFRAACRKILPAFLAAALLTPFLFGDFTKANQNRMLSFSRLYTYTQAGQEQDQAVQEKVRRIGDAVRLRILKDAWAMIKERPFLGSGLGSFLQTQEKLYGKAGIVIDNTMVWILTEMGIAGLAGFLACYAAIFLALLKSAKTTDTEKSLFAQCALLMLLGFGLFSLLHEILYTRFFWFILGMALATRGAGAQGRPADGSESPPPQKNA